MKAFKYFTYWVLFLAPLSLYLHCQYGQAAQWSFAGGILFGLLIDFVAAWCMRKF